MNVGRRDWDTQGGGASLVGFLESSWGGRPFSLSSFLLDVARFRSFMVVCPDNFNPVVGMVRSEI